MSLNNSKGSIVTPILFIVIAFSILLTGGKLANVSTIPPGKELEPEPATINSQNNFSQNVNLNNQVIPTPITDFCRYDTGKKADPLSCASCPGVLIYCGLGKCTDYDASKSTVKGVSEDVCKIAERDKLCDPLNASEGAGWYCN